MELKEINNDLVPYEQSLIIKELGFDESCFGYYSNLAGFIDEYGKSNSSCNKPGMHGKYCAAPTYSQAFRWFRNRHKLINSISEQTVNTFGFYIDKLGDNKVSQFQEYTGFRTYEEAEFFCLLKLIEITKMCIEI